MKQLKILILLAMILIAATIVNAAPLITGIVTDDASGNGIAGANVTVYDTSFNVISSGLTNATGYYSVDAAASLVLRIINASAAGYNTQSVPQFILGPTTLNFDLGPTTSYTLSGTATPNTAGITVTIKQGGVIVDQTTTDGTGAYSLNLLNGTYELEASLAGYDLHSNSSIVINGSDADYDFTLSSSVTTGTMQGYVLNSTGSPLLGASVRLQPSGGLGTLDLQTSAVNGFYSTTYNLGTYDLTASLIGYNDVTQSVTITAGTTDMNFTLGAVCTESVSYGAWGTCTAGSQSRTVTTSDSGNVCGNTIVTTQSQSCSVTTGNGGRGGNTLYVPPPKEVDIEGIRHTWKTDINPKTYTIRKPDSIVFVYEGTSYTLSVKSISDNMVRLKLSPSDDERAGYKGDVFDFNVKNDKFLVTLEDIGQEIIASGALYGTVPTLTLKLFMEKAEAEPVAVSITEKVADGIIKVAAELAPPKDASVPVGIGVAAATMIIGLLLFAGIKKVWL